MKKNFKRKILAIIIILPFFLYIIKSILNLNLESYNFLEVFYLVITNFFLGYILFFVYNLILNSKKRNSKLFIISLTAVISLLFCGWLKYGTINLQSTYNFLNYNDDRNYVNENHIFKEDEIFTLENPNEILEVPKNIQNVVLTTRRIEGYKEIAVNTYVCSEKNCFYNFTLVHVDNKNNQNVIRIPKGYDINKIIIKSDSEDSWLESIEYNNKSVIKDMKKINILFFLFIFVILNLLYYLVKFLNNKFDIIKKYLKLIEKIRIEKVFLVLSITIGIIFSFMIPVYNVPDEGNHMKMIYEELGLENINAQIGEKYKCVSCENSISYKTKNFNFKEYVELSKIKLNDYSFKGFSPKITLIRHLPQAVGLIVGQLLHLPIFWILFFGELFAILFYSFVGYKIIKIIPLKKEVMFFIMLLPMAVQQYSSLSYDLVLNTSCLVLFTLFLKYKFSKEKIDLKKILLIMLLCLSIAICKLPYVLIVLLFLLIPLKQYDIRIGKVKIDLEKIFKNKIIILIGILVTILGLVLIVPKIEFGRILIACILEPLRTLVLIFNTTKQLAHFYLSSCIANFGWLNTSVSKVYILFVCLFAAFLAFVKPKGLKEEKLPLLTKIVMTLIFIGVFVALLIAMTAWTYYINGIGNMSTIDDFRKGLYLIDGCIEGVQGRYFLALLPLVLFLPSRFKLKINQDVYNFLQVLFYIISFSYCIYILLFKFWI